MAHILTIDDSELALEFTRMMVEAEGHTVFSTTAPAEFMHALQHGQPRPDLLIIDAVMPEVTGPELVEKVRQLADQDLAGLPVVICSALEITVAPEAGVLLMSKPFTQEELQSALRLLLD